ncbi:MAG TPA: TatD family deoxyribonuclease [Chromatiaceae bacterium]|nr:TatD family deoxyribonuclease [Chromatiaceae bacterium]HIA07684.1 TatD family deoxyribonuclease [Chromatiaceae bacterium]HIN83097.1 TatD family deoxyribonuclease [Chromatiales bacterium]
MQGATPLVDSHCHIDLLDLEQHYNGDPAEVVQEAQDAGVGHMLCVSVSLQRYASMRALCDPFEQVSFSIGVHPNEDPGNNPDPQILLEQTADPRVVAVGETGLDYFRSEGDLDWQRDRFRDHIAVARQSGKPLIIHSREAAEDTIRLLAEENAAEVGGVMHCFAEDWAVAKQALDLNFYISFSGIVTFNSAQTLKEVAKKVPADRMLVETDCPWLAPVPNRGKPNRPAWVRHVAEHIAELRETTFEQIAAQTTENYWRLFGAKS